MLMPETAMHLDNLVPRWKHEIGRAGKIRPMKPKPVSHTVGSAAHYEFRDSILFANAPHVGAALLRGEVVQHVAHVVRYLSESPWRYHPPAKRPLEHRDAFEAKCEHGCETGVKPLGHAIVHALDRERFETPTSRD
jgi:hypothetical protein